VRLDIRHTWDGQLARPEEVVGLELSRDDRGDWGVAIDAPYHGDPAPTGPPGPTPELWHHEVVEVFLLAPPDHYLEVEIGPHGHHLVLELHGARRPLREGLPLTLQVEREARRWRAHARLERALVPKGVSRVNAYALHGTPGLRRHLAFAPVGGETPDFHRLERFAALDPALSKLAGDDLP